MASATVNGEKNVSRKYEQNFTEVNELRGNESSKICLFRADEH